MLLATLIGSLCLTLYSIVFEEIRPGTLGPLFLFPLSFMFSSLFVVPSTLVFGSLAGRMVQIWRLRDLPALLLIVCFALLAQTIALLIFLFPDWPSFDGLITLSIIAVPYSQSAAIVMWWRLNPPQADCSQSQ